MPMSETGLLDESFQDKLFSMCGKDFDRFKKLSAQYAKTIRARNIYENATRLLENEYREKMVKLDKEFRDGHQARCNHLEEDDECVICGKNLEFGGHGYDG